MVARILRPHLEQKQVAPPLSARRCRGAQEILGPEHLTRGEVVGDELVGLARRQRRFGHGRYVGRKPERSVSVAHPTEIGELQVGVAELVVVGDGVELPCHLFALPLHEGAVGRREVARRHVEELSREVGPQRLHVLEVYLVGPFQVDVHHTGLRSTGHEVVFLHVAHAPTRIVGLGLSAGSHERCQENQVCL